jgi:ABC-type branched-subunit amino acid transport system ATPase component
MTMTTNPNDTLLSVRALTRRFGGVTAVQELSFDIRRNERLAVIGPNGAGKSTLLRMIAGHDRPSAGEIELAGAGRTDGRSPHQLSRAGIALARQIPRPLGSLTVSQNIEVGLAAGASRRNGSAAERLTEILQLTRSCPCSISNGSRSLGRWPRVPSCCCSTRSVPD